ncbi:hypothetical protein APHWI1_0953 [Anaplasma phagocytophilum str. ApWI1]|uniref:Uncharacterized protein n=1 Tax=Anaplasma phagocytophilum str. ApWI1 TaxID=1359155 RepID=A0A0F3PVR5_ANAPH|nr:hypothetical protein APHWI1_0953 [Anaplasma phagocytophilum str. ApWI1]
MYGLQNFRYHSSKRTVVADSQFNFVAKFSVSPSIAHHVTAHISFT